MAEAVLAETSNIIETITKNELPNDHSGIFEMTKGENGGTLVKCSKCITTKCIFQLVTLILGLGVAVFVIIYLKK
jgi:hypothetical protein